VLTDLFAEARFSRHPVDGAQLRTAREALARLQRAIDEVGHNSVAAR
jgi:hypothetical protein